MASGSAIYQYLKNYDSKLVATMGMDLYKRALKLEYLAPQYKNKWVLCPGAFHTVICVLRCLGKTVEGSGIDEAWQEADLYGSVTVTQIINGNHHNRAVHAHQVTLQVLFDLWLGAFLDDHPAVRDSLRSAAEELTDTWLDYAQNIQEYIARLHDMKTTDPDIWQEFVSGEFTVNTSNAVPFTRIGVDQATEHLSKSTKGQGGISGITSCLKTLLKFCLTA